MKIIKLLLIGIAPLILMRYGWVLGQRHQSGYDVAGIFLFLAGVVGLILAFIIHGFTKKFSWHNRWFANIMTGVLGCGFVFALIFIYARWHG
jgi:drug/metabolite transporter (DMT)-like permease